MSDKTATLPPLPVTRNDVTFNFEYNTTSRGDLKGRLYPSIPCLRVEKDFDAFVNFVGKDWLLNKGLQAFNGVAFEAFKESLTYNTGEKDDKGEPVVAYKDAFDDEAKAAYIEYIQKLQVRGETLSELEEQYAEKMEKITAAADLVASISEDPSVLTQNPDAMLALKELANLRKEVKEIKHAMDNRRRTVKKAA